MEEEAAKARRYLFWAIIAGIIVIAYLMLKDLFIAILTSVILAYLTKPLYERLSKKINKKISALITVAIILLVLITIFLAFIGAFVTQLLKFLSQQNISRLINILSNFIESPIIQENIGAIVSSIGEATIAMIPSTLTYIPGLIINFVVIFFTTYYLLIEWDELENKLIGIMPFKNKREIVEKIKNKTHEILSGTFIIVLIEFIISAIALKLLGVGPYLVLAFAIGLLAFIPAIGPMVIWLPLAIIEFLYGKHVTAVGVLILGLILSGIIDSMLRAKIIGKKTGTHPVIMLFGIIGGIKLFGIIGLIIGPLILIILATIIDSMSRQEEKR